VILTVAVIGLGGGAIHMRRQLESYRKLIEQQERISSALTRSLGNAPAAAPATAR